MDVSFKYLQLALNQIHPDKSKSSHIATSLKPELIATLKKNFCPDTSPNEIAQILFRLSAKLAKNPDPWQEIRTKSNEIALSMLDGAQNQINQQTPPKLRLYHAFIWSVVGNLIDFGTSGHNFQLNTTTLLQTYTKVYQQGFKINHFSEFWDQLPNHKTCLYLCDNAGEIAFDTLVIKELQSLGLNVTAVVKGGPISNDAILEDAEQVGLRSICPVITTGSPDLGFFPNGNSKEFTKLLSQSTLVIAKGQANWEAIYAYQNLFPKSVNFFSIAQIKCHVHARLFGLEKGTNIFYHVKSTDFTE